MEMLSHVQARQIAETLWGRGGTSSATTNRNGAFYFSCSGHGGFVIDAAALTSEEYVALSKYVEPEKAKRYTFGRKSKILWSGSRRAIRVPVGTPPSFFEFFVLEEDCAWALAYVLTGVRHKSVTAAQEQCARETFWNWYDESNPVVQHRMMVDKKREERDADLIVSALNISNTTNTKVWTADGKEYIVSDYCNARDEFGTPWLSRCNVIEKVS